MNKSIIRFFVTIIAILYFQTLLSQDKNNVVLTQKIDSILHSYFKSEKQPGIATAIIEKGKVIYSNKLGLANIEHNIPVTDSTAFHIASVSKQFTSFLALLLEKEGRLTMTDDLRTHIKELNHLPYKITLSQLANHTHGLPNVHELAQLKDINVEDRMTHKDVVNMLLQIKTINFKPGAQFEYNNTGFVLLAEVIERVSNKPFQEVIKEKIFDSLQMKNTQAIPNSDVIIKNRANSYRLHNGVYENYALNLRANGSSGISITINDFVKWAKYYQNSTKDARDIFNKMKQPSTLNNGKNIHYGLGLETKKHKGLDIVFHGGGDAGYTAYILHVPKHQLSIVTLENSAEFGGYNFTYNVIDLLLKQKIVEPKPPKKTTYTTKELKPFTGTYQFQPGNYFNILAEKDTLYFQSYGSKSKLPLPVVGDNIFSFPYINIPSSTFTFYPNKFDFNIADFKYSCTKLQLNPPKKENINLSEFTGIYKNNEFNIIYEIAVIENNLVVKHSFNYDANLYPLDKDSFYAAQGFGKLDFIKSKKGKVKSFKLSGRNLKDIEFIKVK